MTNEYFNALTPLVEHQLARGSDVNAIFAAIAAGFDKLPQPGLMSAFATTTGSAGAYVLTPSPALPALVRGAQVRARFHVTSTAAPTINVSGKGAKPIRDALNGTLATGALMQNRIAELDYDGSSWRVQSLESVETITGFGIGAVGSSMPLLIDFHDTGLGAGLYRYNSETLNSPSAGSSGSAILTYRGDGLAHWTAHQITGATGLNAPVTAEKRTSGAANDWGFWVFQYLQGSIADETGQVNNRYFRIGGMQICTAELNLTRISVTALGRLWRFAADFAGAPWFMGGSMPNNIEGTFTDVDPTDIGGCTVQMVDVTTPGSVAGQYGQVAFRKTSSSSFASTAAVTRARAFAIGRWY